MKLLLTGATGFVGRNLLLRALRQGHEVFAPVRTPEKLLSQLKFEGVETPPPSLRLLPADPASWPALPVDQAVLCAGVLFARDRQEYFDTNVGWTLRVIEKLSANCRAVLLSSQSAGGPTPANKSARAEDDADTPLTWYGESKLELERGVRKNFPNHAISILRPPMILGARDAATLPLFRMADGLLRIKPGMTGKSFSFLAVDDLLDAIEIALEKPPLQQSLYVASPEEISDWELIAAAAAARRAKGITMPVPLAGVKILSAIVDAVPSLRAKTPSLTRDRAREIWPSRWVVNSSAFASHTGWQARTGLVEALKSAEEYYVREGALRSRI